MRNLLAILLVLSSSAFCEEWRAVDGPFMAMVFLSDNPQQVYDAWNNGPANGVKMHVLPSIPAGQPIEAIVVFSGCTPDKNGNCKIEADWLVTTPSGEVVGEAMDAPLWSSKPAPVAGQLQISENGLGIVAASGHHGYVFKVKVKDKVSGHNVEIIQRIKVVGT